MAEREQETNKTTQEAMIKAWDIDRERVIETICTGLIALERGRSSSKGAVGAGNGKT
jgi:hypothetical protein